MLASTTLTHMNRFLISQCWLLSYLAGLSLKRSLAGFRINIASYYKDVATAGCAIAEDRNINRPCIERWLVSPSNSLIIGSYFFESNALFTLTYG